MNVLSEHTQRYLYLYVTLFLYYNIYVLTDEEFHKFNSFMVIVLFFSLRCKPDTRYTCIHVTVSLSHVRIATLKLSQIVLSLVFFPFYLILRIHRL